MTDETAGPRSADGPPAWSRVSDDPLLTRWCRRDIPGWKLYLAQFSGLLGGGVVPVSDYPLERPANISSCSDEELRMLIDLTLWHLDGLTTQLEQIRLRAQFLFTTLVVLLGLSGAVLPGIVDANQVWSFLILGLAVVMLLLALLGSTGIIVNLKLMGGADPAWLSRQQRPWLLACAHEYIDGLGFSVRTVATQVRLTRHTALLTVMGAIGVGAAWCVSFA